DCLCNLSRHGRLCAKLEICQLLAPGPASYGIAEHKGRTRNPPGSSLIGHWGGTSLPSKLTTPDHVISVESVLISSLVNHHRNQNHFVQFANESTQIAWDGSEGAAPGFNPPVLLVPTNDQPR